MANNLYPFKSGLGLVEPVALTNENVCIVYGDDSYYRKVAWFESLPPFQFLDIGAIGAQANSGKISAVNLQFQDEEFAQIRWFVLDNVQVRLWLPDADGKYRTRQMMSYVDLNTVYRDPDLHLTEFFIWEDHNPWFEALNGMDYALTQCRLIGMGYRYKAAPLGAEAVAAIKNGTLPCTYVFASGRT
jgi:hypothetical protein